MTIGGASSRPLARDAGWDPGRVAQVWVDYADGHRPRVGSGYLVNASTVLTAWHLVKDAKRVTIQFPASLKTSPVAGIGIGQVGRGDVALVRLSSPVERSTPVAKFGALDAQAEARVEVAGFPRWKLRRDDGDEPAAGDGAEKHRELAHEYGTVAPKANRGEGTLQITVRAPPARDPEGYPPWEGISGGPVFHQRRIVAVVSKQHSREGESRLAAAPIPSQLLEDEARSPASSASRTLPNGVRGRSSAATGWSYRSGSGPGPWPDQRPWPDRRLKVLVASVAVLAVVIAASVFLTTWLLRTPNSVIDHWLLTTADLEPGQFDVAEEGFEEEAEEEQVPCGEDGHDVAATRGLRAWRYFETRASNADYALDGNEIGSPAFVLEEVAVLADPGDVGAPSFELALCEDALAARLDPEAGERMSAFTHNEWTGFEAVLCVTDVEGLSFVVQRSNVLVIIGYAIEIDSCDGLTAPTRDRARQVAILALDKIDQAKPPAVGQV